jgi:DNA-binding response OmpR family regulator
MKRVLIIEDDKLLGTIYQRKFSDAKISVQIATTGREGMDAVETYRPHAMLLDLMLPDVNGVDVLKELRANPSTQGLPVVVFTNAFLPGPIAKVKAAGATDVITKSDCPVSKLIERLAALMESSSYEPPATKSDTVLIEKVPEVDPHEVLHQRGVELEASLERFLVIPSDTNRMVSLSHVTHGVAGHAAADGQQVVAWMASALEALHRDLFEKAQHRNPSSTNTIADGTRLVASWLKGERPIPQRPPSGCRILAVDDDPIMSAVVGGALARANLKCRTMQDPIKALEVLRQDVFDLVLLDVEMPAMDGPQLCAVMRQQSQNKDTPVIFVTAVGDFERRKQSLASGGNDLLAKPILPMELAVKALTHLLRHASR